MEVTIIIPTFNYGQFISDTLKCIAAQTHHDFECLIIDDGSTDNTREVVLDISRKDPRFHYIKQKNGGASNARNTGIKHAKGNYIQFLDSDDLLTPTKIEYQLKVFKECPYADIVYGRYIYFKDIIPDVKGKDDTWTQKISGNGHELIKNIFETNLGMMHSLLIKKEVIDNAGYFDESLKIFEDWKYWAKCALQNIYFKYDDSDETIVFVRKGHTSLQSDTKSTERDYMKLQKWMLNAVIDASLPDDVILTMKQQYVKTHGLRNPDITILKDKYMRNLIMSKASQKILNLFNR
jgi:glycosyltransferase involved in cell wall biosynthesis